jgi:hypothetical protein
MEGDGKKIIIKKEREREREGRSETCLVKQQVKRGKKKGRKYKRSSLSLISSFFLSSSSFLPL